MITANTGTDFWQQIDNHPDNAEYNLLKTGFAYQEGDCSMPKPGEVQFIFPAQWSDKLKKKPVKKRVAGKDIGPF